MKITTKILHLLWAGFWCYLMLWAFPTDAPWKFLVRHPFEIAKPLLGLVWLLFAISLLFERRWAWQGSLLFTVISLLCTVYIVLVTNIYSLPAPTSGGDILEGVGALLLPALVLAALLLTRRQFVKAQDKAA